MLVASKCSVNTLMQAKFKLQFLTIKESMQQTKTPHFVREVWIKSQKSNVVAFLPHFQEPLGLQSKINSRLFKVMAHLFRREIGSYLTIQLSVKTLAGVYRLTLVEATIILRPCRKQRKVVYHSPPWRAWLPIKSPQWRKTQQVLRPS